MTQKQPDGLSTFLLCGVLQALPAKLPTQRQSPGYTDSPEALAKELAPSNIQVNAIACGVIDTDMNSQLSDDETCSSWNMRFLPDVSEKPEEAAGSRVGGIAHAPSLSDRTNHRNRRRVYLIRYTLRPVLSSILSLILPGNDPIPSHPSESSHPSACLSDILTHRNSQYAIRHSSLWR